MWVQLDRDQVERLAGLAVAAGYSEIGDRLRSRIEEEAEAPSTAEAYRRAAECLHGREGELEFDDDAVVSGGVGAGAYVMGWRWVEACERGTVA